MDQRPFESQVHKPRHPKIDPDADAPAESSLDGLSSAEEIDH